MVYGSAAGGRGISLGHQALESHKRIVYHLPVTDGRIHPGAFLSKALADLGVSQAALARVIGVSPMRISHVVKGTRPVTAELALLLGRAFDQSPHHWLSLQARYDLAMARARLGPRLRSARSVKAAQAPALLVRR
jgi:antitoxin HigA-1